MRERMTHIGVPKRIIEVPFPEKIEPRRLPQEEPIEPEYVPETNPEPDYIPVEEPVRVDSEILPVTFKCPLCDREVREIDSEIGSLFKCSKHGLLLPDNKFEPSRRRIYA